jgi:hypothetical protein
MALEWLPFRGLLLASLLYGGVPYAALALGATWWIEGRSEPEIQRAMVRAPLLMVVVYVIFALVAGVAVRQMAPFIAVAILGAIVILPVGYVYVGVAMLLRLALGPPMR